MPNMERFCIFFTVAFSDETFDKSCRSVIPRLHDEAGSTSWLVERSSSQLVEPASSCKRGISDRMKTLGPIDDNNAAKKFEKNYNNSAV